MKFRNIAATATIAIAALSITSVTANVASAQPDSLSNSSVSTDIAPGIHYKANIVDHSVVIATDAGSLAVKDNQVQIVDNSGAAVATLPLSYQANGKSFPIAARIDGDTATLTPNTDPAAAQPITPGAPVIKQVDATANANFNQAISNLANEVSVGVAIGSLIGTVIGAGIGCIAGGAILGAGATAATIGTLTIPGAIGGCLVTGAAAAAIGLVAGTIFIGGPVAAVALFQFFNDLATPPAPAAAPAPADAAAPPAA
ncbi:MAG: hypothetical protein JWN03_3109 [Nocardia sp.]|uniref:hypothetical protein n=1 Tax=Nocardia sp. TaxID=1821 RepID=UPI00263714DC|nr:hypothetical protein [Nocardia sp.]MCU1642834.1 hypothetical protein [Nocardia sp.]